MCDLAFHPAEKKGLILIQVWCCACENNNSSMNSGCRVCCADLCPIPVKRARAFNALKVA